MKIGYVNKEENEGSLVLCDTVLRSNPALSSVRNLAEFVSSHPTGDLYIASLDDIDLQLIQLLPIFVQLLNEGRILHVVNRFPMAQLSEEAYFKGLLVLAQSEKNIVSNRIKLGMETGLDGGTVYGRPTIQKDKVAEIQNLFKNYSKSYREIAESCDVSIGTVHKYVNMLLETPTNNE